ncbi:hypothetical protein, partial [Pseudomonas fluorescens]|uniref:hypothetical protein n=1 Tax=Pseudomonas fluorescens TaxID=294 RepID=UPI001A922B5C
SYILFDDEVSGLLICAFDLDLKSPHRGGPPNHCRITGMPSLSEAPSVGAKTFWLLLCLYKSDPL